MHFEAGFNRQKTRTVTKSLGTRILRFNYETKLTKTVQKLSKNSWSDQGGGRSHHPPPVNTPLSGFNRFLLSYEKKFYAGSVRIKQQQWIRKMEEWMMKRIEKARRTDWRTCFDRDPRLPARLRWRTQTPSRCMETSTNSAQLSVLSKTQRH